MSSLTLGGENILQIELYLNAVVIEYQGEITSCFSDGALGISPLCPPPTRQNANVLDAY